MYADIKGTATNVVPFLLSAIMSGTEWWMGRSIKLFLEYFEWVSNLLQISLIVLFITGAPVKVIAVFISTE